MQLKKTWNIIIIVIPKVPLGVQLLNENKVDEMCAILDQLQKYVPTICSSETTYLPSGESYTYQIQTCMK